MKVFKSAVQYKVGDFGMRLKLKYIIFSSLVWNIKWEMLEES